MRRSILVSLMVIGAVVAVVAGASTFAPFQDAATGSGAVTSGTVNLLYNLEAGDVEVITFGTGTLCDAGELATQDTCTHGISITNAGTLAFTYTIDAWVDDDGADTGSDGSAGDVTANTCFNIELTQAAPSTELVISAANRQVHTPAVGATSYSLPDDTDFNTGEAAEVWNLSITVDDTGLADPGCQGVSKFVQVRLLATQSTTPHD